MQLSSIAIIISLFILSACKSEGNKTSEKNNVLTTSESLNPTDTIADSTAIKTSVTLPDDKKTTIYFPKDTYDFGKITESDVVTHVFSFTNSGDEVLVLRTVRGSCGCTVPEYSKKPIPPGEKGEIKVTFDSKGRNGPNTKGIFVEANTEPELTILKITTDVMPKEKKKLQPTQEEKEKIEAQQKEMM